MAIGNFLCLAMAGEICIPYLEILENLCEDFSMFFAGCSNECVAYIPSEAMLPQSGYEVSGNHTVYFYPAPFGAGDTPGSLVAS